jgi:vancomycin resistance protein VanW
MNLRQYIPAKAKLRYQLIRRAWRDWRSGLHTQFARAHSGAPVDFPHRISLQQAIMPSSTIAAKRNNFRLAIKRISPIEIHPGEVFSFWRAVGAPTRANGFKEGRTIIDGKLQPSAGGGLCQISGLIYAVSLPGGLTVLERHNHSVDIYTEATRYTPLGSDATVAYGYKDLRLRNDTDRTLSFSFTLEDDAITVHLNGTSAIPERAVAFRPVTTTESSVSVATIIDGQELGVSHYRKLPEPAAVPPLILDYDPIWPQQFEQLREFLLEGFDGLPVEIEHVGSTAVPGLAAKSIIDVDIVQPPSVPLTKITERLAALGYEHVGDQGIPGREVYKRKAPTTHVMLDQIRHHLYVCLEGNRELERHLQFRDQLRAKAQYRSAYQKLKREIAEAAGQDKKQYAQLKQERARAFIEEVLRNVRS